MSDHDSHAETVITVQPPGKYLALEAFGLIALNAEFEPKLFREHVRLLLAATVLPDSPLSDDERLFIIRGLTAMAEAGHVAAGRELLALAIKAFENPRAEINAALREWLGSVLRRLIANPKGAGVEAFAPRPAGDGRRPACSDDLAARLTFETIQFLGCSFALTAKVTDQLKASAAFDHAAERLTQWGFVDPTTAEPFTGAAVRGWFYSSGCNFDFDSPDSPVSIQRTTPVE